MIFVCVFVTFPCGVLGQVWYLIVSFSDLCLLSYFYEQLNEHEKSFITSGLGMEIRIATAYASVSIGKIEKDFFWYFGVKSLISQCMSFPTSCHFNMYRLGRASAASF